MFKVKHQVLTVVYKVLGDLAPVELLAPPTASRVGMAHSSGHSCVLAILRTCQVHAYFRAFNFLLPGMTPPGLCSSPPFPQASDQMSSQQGGSHCPLTPSHHPVSPQCSSHPHVTHGFVILEDKLLECRDFPLLVAVVLAPGRVDAPFVL